MASMLAADDHISKENEATAPAPSSSEKELVVQSQDVAKLGREVADLLREDEELRSWCSTAVLERFLRADQGSLKKASKRLRETLKWCVFLHTSIHTGER